MNTKNTQKTVGVSTPRKETLFSLSATETGVRIRLVSNVPPQHVQDRIVRNRVRAD
jgi:hypothetical protein